MFLILLLMVFCCISGSCEQNDISWYKGCYEPVKQNATKFRVSNEWHGPAHCTEICGNARQRYAAVQGSTSCYCLQTLKWHQKVNSANCSYTCTHATHLRCGGGQFVTIFDARVQVISNVSIVSQSHVNIANISKFFCYALLTKPWTSRMDLRTRGNTSSSRVPPLGKGRRSVLVSWSIDGKIIKVSNKSVDEYKLNDTVYHKFLSGGIHSLCCNISTKYSWLSKCNTVFGLESIRTFQLVNIVGGQHVRNGLYAISQHKPFFIDIVVNAGSFAIFLFDFGDGASLVNVTTNYSTVKKNCSCLVLRRKSYTYTKRGVFSLNITAMNELGSHSLVFPAKVLVDGIITGVQIVTNFAAAGKRKRIILDVYGSFTHAMYDWKLENGEIRTSNEPYIHVFFPTLKPQYHIKVTVYNNVSSVETSKIIYVEPEIKDVMLEMSSNVSSVNSNVILKSTPQTDKVGFVSSIRYKWMLGDGVSLPGTLANLVYKYKTSGRFEARVRAENFVSHAYSKSVTMHIYEIITKVDITYDSFLFGEITRLHASVMDGSSVTYIWDFGDGSKIVTPNHTVLHNYTQLGNYSVMVTAKNPVSVKEDTAKLFVLLYYCEKPRVSVSSTSYLEYIRVSSKITLDIDVSVNCSASNKTIYKWKVFKIIDGERVEKNPLEIGVSPLTFSERSLILPPYSLTPGKYVIELVVQMLGTIVHTRLSRIVNILPSEIMAIISGGKKVLITRKSHKNITLDASKSYDPDDKNFTNFRYQWKCKSILGNGFGECFKPNATFGVNWTLPTLRFLPRIFVKSSSLFAFIATVSRDEVKRSRAVQFIEVQDQTVRRLQIECSHCRGTDVNSHRDIKFLGTCVECGNTTMLFQWKVSFKPKKLVFLHHFDICVPADGSSWKNFLNLNETNSTATTAPATSLTTVLTSTAGSTEITFPSTEKTNLQRVICEAELDTLRKNWTNLDSKLRRKREIFAISEDLTWNNDKTERSLSIWDDINDEKDENFDDKDETFMDEIAHRSQRAKRNIENRTNSSTSSGITANSTDTNDIDGLNSAMGSTLAPISGGSVLSGSGNGQSIDNPDEMTGLVSDRFPPARGSGRGPNGAGTGSGRGPSNSQGTGRGCEGSSGITGGIGAGSGGSGSTGGCNGNGDGFGAGARAHQNKTKDSQVNGTTGTDGTTSGNLVSDDKTLLQDEVKMIREIINQHVLTKDANVGLDSDELVVKRNTLKPGQLFKVDFVAFWLNDGGRKRIAGRVSQYFLTNTGPYLGNCKISPQVGTELRTIFSLDCSHWKDKHHPLTFSVKYWSPSTKRHILIYSGLYTKLKFTLPAGNSSANSTIDIEITIEDTENVKTELCPLQIQVFPLAADSSTLEQKLFNKTLGSRSLLEKCEDTSDKVAAIIFISNIANTLNRLGVAKLSSTSQKIREKIRMRLLQSIYSFNILSKVFALQLSGIAREVVAKPNEVSLKSVEWSNAICDKIMFFHKNHVKGLSNEYSAEIGKDLFAVLSSAIYSASRQKINQWNREYVGKLVKDSIRIRGDILKILQQVSSHPTLSGEFVTTLSMPYLGEKTNKILSINGNTFILPDNFGEFLQNASAGSNKIYAALTIYENNPFRWGKNEIKIDTKVASLDFFTGAGQAINISNLTKPIEIRFPVAKPLETNVTRFSVNLSKMKIHQFNLTSIKTALFIKIEDEDTNEYREHYSLKAVVGYNNVPSQKLHNISLKFVEGKSVVRILPSKETSKVYIGLFLKASGKVAKRNSVSRHYKLSVYTASCRFWDENSELWSSNGCEANLESTASEIICNCNHLTAFGGSVEVLDGTVAVSTLIDFTRSNDLHYLLAIVLAITCLHLLLMVVYLVTSRSSDLCKNVANLPDNHPADLFKYLVIVETGSSYGAGTTGRVSIIVYGEEGHSQIRELTCYDAEQFKRGSTNCVIMSFPDSLGDIKKIRLWHDNGGSAPDWFLKQVIIVDCQSDKKWYFHWNNWLAISEKTTADCEILARKEPLSYIMQTIFEGFLDYHFWISIFTRPARSKFTSFQRSVTSFTILVSYMTIAAVFLHNNETDELFGIWDIRWTAVILGIICSLCVLPVQLTIEAFFRNMSGHHVCKESDEMSKMGSKTLPDEDINMSNGAVFFMEFNSSTHSSQQILRKDDDVSSKVLQNPKRVKSEVSYRLLLKRIDIIFVLLWFLLSASGISLTMLYSLSFQHKDIILWIHILLLSFLHSMFFIEMIKALILSIRRFYRLNGDENIRKYIHSFNFFERFEEYSKQENFTEKQIMVARARARFVRFSKPILGKDLRKARKKTVSMRNLFSFLWHASTSFMFLITLLLILLNSDSSQKYYRNNAVRNMVNSGNRSFESISTVEQFWNWSKNSLVDLLVWKNWHHLRNASGRDSMFENKIYTFGPAHLEKEDSEREKESVTPGSSPQNSTALSEQILLVGERHMMINILNELQSNQWICSATNFVKISFVYFHPETSLFSNIMLLIQFSPPGRLNTFLEVESVILCPLLDYANEYLVVMQAICFLLMIIILRNEFSSMMDRGMKHLKCGWNVIEAMLVLLVVLACIFYVWLYIATKKAQYLADSMELNDASNYLDVKRIIFFKKAVLFVHATLLFLAILRTMKLLLVWRRLPIIFSMLSGAFSGILSLLMISAIITFAFTHMGIIILMPLDHTFSRVGLAWGTLWTSVIRSNWNYMEEYLTDIWISPLYGVLSGLILLALRRMSVVLFIGRFKEAISHKRRYQACLVKTLKQRLRKLRSKKMWLQIFSNLWSKVVRKQGEQYKACNLPLENVYEEIEYQVEEVLFRLNNLFDMNSRNEKVCEEEDELTLDSSEEAAYPSSYSTKDSISFTSESLYSEDSGYYRYGEYRERCSSISNSDSEYEGPIIHHLEPRRQLFSDFGQKLTPIFGGRYFVKTSWSTFRTPKIQPGSIRMEPPPKVLPPIRKRNCTFDKVSNWSTKCSSDVTDESTTADIFSVPLTNIEPNHFEDASDRKDEKSIEMVSIANPPHRLPKALETMAHRVKFAPKFNERTTSPIQLPPTMAELKAKGRKCPKLKRSQIAPMHANSEHSLSTLSENSTAHVLFLPAGKMRGANNFVRSSSVDSGIIHSSGTEDIPADISTR